MKQESSSLKFPAPFRKTSVVVTVVFAVLKLTGVIGWSWLWVMSPVLISVALGFLIVFLFFVLYGLTQ